MIHGDQDNILQHNDEANTRAQDVSVQMPQIVAQGDTASASGDGLDGVQGVQGQMKQSVLKGSVQDQGGVQCVQSYVLNNLCR